MPSKPTDTEILDWLEREGHESIVRLASSARGKWGSLWSKPPITAEKDIFNSYREAAIFGMRASQGSRYETVDGHPCTECGGEAYMGYTANKTSDWGGLVKNGERLCDKCFRRRGGRSVFSSVTLTLDK